MNSSAMIVPLSSWLTTMVVQLLDGHLPYRVYEWLVNMVIVVRKWLVRMVIGLSSATL